MDCKDVEGLLPAYALDALDPQETAEVEAHLDTCPWCAALMREQVQVAASLAQAAELIEPPQGLRSSTLKAVGAQGQPSHQVRRRRLLLPGRLAMGAAASVVVGLIAAIIGLGFYTSDQVNDLQEENAQLSVQLSQLSRQDDRLLNMFVEQRSLSYIMASTDKQVLALQTSDAVPQARGMLLISSQGGSGILMAKGLEPSSGDDAYYVWMGRDGQSFIVGRLSVDETGWGVLTLWPEQPISLFQNVWVNAGLTPAPVLWGSISAP